MMFNVPQFIDIEDKIVGPLTAKQLGWMAAAGVVLLIAWGLLDTPAFWLVAIVTVGIFGALAFYKPYNQPLSKFIMSSFSYTTKPKVYVWKRDFSEVKAVKKAPTKKKTAPVIKKKTLNDDKIKEISQMLDNK